MCIRDRHFLVRDLALDAAPEHMLEVLPHGVQEAVRFFEQLSWPSPRVKIMSPTADIVVRPINRLTRSSASTSLRPTGSAPAIDVAIQLLPCSFISLATPSRLRILIVTPCRSPAPLVTLLLFSRFGCPSPLASAFF